MLGVVHVADTRHAQTTPHCMQVGADDPEGLIGVVVTPAEEAGDENNTTRSTKQVASLNTVLCAWLCACLSAWLCVVLCVYVWCTQ